MNLEWQQLLTHLVGFLITVWILKKYAWKPLLGLMEERRNKIAGEFQKIEEEKESTAKLSAQYEASLKDIEKVRRERLIEAADEGKKLASEIKATAQEEVKQLHVKTKANLVREIAKARVQLRDELVTMTMTATERSF